MARRLIKEGTSNFGIENRCVVVARTDQYSEEGKREWIEEWMDENADDYTDEDGNVDRDQMESDAEEAFERLLNDQAQDEYYDVKRAIEKDAPDGVYYEIVLEPGYYEAASIDICEKGSWNSLGSDILDRVSEYLNDPDEEEINAEEVVDESVEYVLGNDWSEDAKAQIKKIILDHIVKDELEDGEVEYEINGYSGNDWSLDEPIDKILMKEDYEKLDKWLDKFADENGFDEYAVSARFSNGETMYSKVDRKKTNESLARRGRVLKESRTKNEIAVKELLKRRPDCKKFVEELVGDALVSEDGDGIVFRLAGGWSDLNPEEEWIEIENELYPKFLDEFLKWSADIPVRMGDDENLSYQLENIMDDFVKEVEDKYGDMAQAMIDKFLKDTNESRSLRGRMLRDSRRPRGRVLQEDTVYDDDDDAEETDSGWFDAYATRYQVGEPCKEFTKLEKALYSITKKHLPPKDWYYSIMSGKRSRYDETKCYYCARPMVCSRVLDFVVKNKKNIKDWFLNKLERDDSEHGEQYETEWTGTVDNDLVFKMKDGKTMHPIRDYSDWHSYSW